MNKLILTNLDSFEVTNKENVFLGPWCFRDEKEREKYWDSYQFRELFVNAGEFEDASLYIRGLSERLLIEYSQKLNDLHSRNYSLEYWRILVMPWIIRSLEIFFIRYKQIKKLSDNEYFVSIYENKHQNIFLNSRDFYNFLLGENGQYFSYSLLIDFLKPENFIISYTPELDKKLRTDHLKKIERHNTLNELKRNLVHINRIILANLTGIYIDGIKGINTSDILYMSIMLLSKKQDSKENQFNFNKFNTESSLKIEHKEFEEFTNTILFKLIPQSFTTRFKENEKNAKRKLLLLSKRNNLLFIGAIMGGIDSQRFFLAQYKEERKGKILISQHGGLSYGISRSFPAMAMIEYMNADYFLTWGWEKHANYQVNAIPLPSPQLSKKIGKRKNPSKNLVMVGTQARLVNDRLASRIQTEQCMSYRKEKIKFIDSLQKKNRNNLLYRPYFSEVDSYPERNYLKEKVPSLELIENDFDKRLFEAKCVIIDHPGTTFDISISANIPTIIFWDRNSWLFTEDGEKILDILQKTKVFHPNGESAADFINSSIEDMENWWNNDETRSSIHLYQTHYARISEAWRDDWTNLISKLK
jgi:putative transferase (TIGR04331 family)